MKMDAKEEVRNAQIESTMLGLEDHGCLTFWLHLKFDGTGQGFGGFGMDEPVTDETGKFLRRKGTEFGCEVILRVLNVVGVEKWEDLKGKYLRVRGGGWSGPIEGIGNIIEERWFNMKELAAEFYPEAEAAR